MDRNGIIGVGGVFCVLFLVAAAVLFWLRARKSRETHAVQSVAVARAADAARGQPGAAVAVQGTIACDAPLVAPMSSKACVYFFESVVDTWDTTRRDAEGNTDTVEMSKTLAENTQLTPFRIADASGTIAIVPDKAKVVAPETHRHQEPSSVGFTPASRTFLERALEVGTFAYVLGVVQADGAIGMPAPHSEHLFIIDHRRQQELLTANVRALKLYAWFAGASLLIGAALLAVVVSAALS